MKDRKVIKTTNSITTEELYEKIKDCKFTAGTPEYKEMGIFKQIKLPAVGRYCIQIMASGTRIRLIMNEDMGQTGTYVANSMVRGKLGVFAKALDKDKKPSLELLEKTAAELRGYVGA